MLQAKLQDALKCPADAAGGNQGRSRALAASAVG